MFINSEGITHMPATQTRSVLQSGTLTPRDLNNLSELKNHGLSLVEVRISQVSAARGKYLESIALPAHTRVVCVMQNRQPVLDLSAVFLNEGDSVYLLTDDEDMVRSLFTI